MTKNYFCSFFFKVHSWWPWRSSLDEGKCVLRTQDGWLKRPCDELQAFICERDINQQSILLTVRCGNAQAPITSIITTTTRTRRPTVSFIQPPIEHEEISLATHRQDSFVSLLPPMVTSMNTKQEKSTIETKSNSIDPSKFC